MYHRKTNRIVNYLVKEDICNRDSSSLSNFPKYDDIFFSYVDYWNVIQSSI